MKMRMVLFLSMVLIVSGIIRGQNQNEPELKFLIKTSMGNIKIKLYNDTPKHRDNFVKLVKSGWYNSSIFHRVINTFMIQGGGSFNPKDSSYKEDVGYTIPAEILPNHFHFRGALAAARTPDNVNPKKESSGCQFYIVQGRKFIDSELDATQKRSGRVFTQEERETYKTIGGAPHLDGNYTVFGEVIEGMDVVDKIAAVQVGEASRPVKNIVFSIVPIK